MPMTTPKSMPMPMPIPNIYANQCFFFKGVSELSPATVLLYHYKIPVTPAGKTLTRHSEYSPFGRKDPDRLAQLPAFRPFESSVGLQIRPYTADWQALLRVLYRPIRPVKSPKKALWPESAGKKNTEANSLTTCICICIMHYVYAYAGSFSKCQRLCLC
jgi:hypothetical protein